MQWEIVIGLEVHVQLATNSKLFSRSSTSFADVQNSNAGIFDLGLPGVLPVLNTEAINMAISFGLAVNAGICQKTIFARKHYFYPDSPKGYQTSQMDLPIVHDGELYILDDAGKNKKINIERAHLEEDAGKSIHDLYSNKSAIDLNRVSTPLIEVVSKPDISSAKEAVRYLKKIHGIIRALKISDGNMAEGSMRCDANVSIKRFDDKELGTRVEIKNLNSFRFIEKAINYEVARQTDVLESGGVVHQETRLYDQSNNTTKLMRSKEDANDYRYFPDPDLLPVVIDDEIIADISKNLPELPEAKKTRFMEQYKLNNDMSAQLVDDVDLANYFEEVVKTSKDPKQTANWVTGVLTSSLYKMQKNIQDFPLPALTFGLLLLRINDNTISNTAAKEVFEQLEKDPSKSIDDLISECGLEQISDTGALLEIVNNTIESNSEQVEQYKLASDDKKNKLIGFFVGQVMKASKGKANPQQAKDLLNKQLSL